MTTTTTALPDADLHTLQAHYDVDERWWDEAQHITTALLEDRKPDVCRRKPWSTFATYMMFGGNIEAQFRKANATEPADAQRALASVVADCAEAQHEAQDTADNRKPTDDELRDRWLKHNRLVAHGMGEWRMYQNGLWPEVNETLIERQIVRVLEDAKSEGIRPTDSRLNSVKRFCRIEVFKDADVWDADPDLLVCQNGMLHIPTKTLKPHTPLAYQTTGVPYAYDPQATCPTFVDALTRLPYRVVQFLQEFAGYSLTTDTSYEIAVWFLGKRGCGKSTIITALHTMLGDRSDVLSLKQVVRSRFGLGSIVGKTLIYAFENPSMYLETTDTVNALVSGEPLVVERKYKPQATIIPRAKVLWAMNKLPRIKDAGDGLFRRVQIVRFEPLPESERDPTVKEQIKEEGSGILNWALIGLDRLRKRGRFHIPPEIQAVNEEFQEGNDPASAFVRDCCETKLNPIPKDFEEQSSVLYDAYEMWCKDNGHTPMSSTAVATEWRRLGFVHHRKSDGVYWKGVNVFPSCKAWE